MKKPAIFINIDLSLWKDDWPELTRDDMDQVGQIIIEAFKQTDFRIEGAWSLEENAPVSPINKPQNKGK